MRSIQSSYVNVAAFCLYRATRIRAIWLFPMWHVFVLDSHKIIMVNGTSFEFLSSFAEQRQSWRTQVKSTSQLTYVEFTPQWRSSALRHSDVRRRHAVGCVKLSGCWVTINILSLKPRESCSMTSLRTPLKHVKCQSSGKNIHEICSAWAVQITTYLHRMCPTKYNPSCVYIPLQ